MSDVLELARGHILGPSDVDQAAIESALTGMLGHSIDFAEVYLQRVRSEAWGLEDGIVKDGSFSVDAGIGVRALSGEKTGFAYCEDVQALGPVSYTHLTLPTNREV